MSNAFLQLLTWKFHVKYTRGSGRAIRKKNTQERKAFRSRSEQRRERGIEREREREKERTKEKQMDARQA